MVIYFKLQFISVSEIERRHGDGRNLFQSKEHVVRRWHHCACHSVGVVSSQNGIMSPRNTHCARILTYGAGVPRFRAWILTHLVYPLADEMNSSVDSGGENVLDLREVDVGSRVDMVHSVEMGDYSIYLVDIKLITEFFR